MADKEKHFWDFQFTVTRLVRCGMLHGRPYAQLEAESGMSASERVNKQKGTSKGVRLCVYRSLSLSLSHTPDCFVSESMCTCIRAVDDFASTRYGPAGW